MKRVQQGQTEGLFPSKRPANVSSSRTPEDVLLLLANYEKWAEVWDDVDGSISMNRVHSESGADVVIKGYWDEDNHHACGSSIACTYVTGSYPYIGDEREFWIEDPPHWGHEANARQWTTDFKDATDPIRGAMYQHLPTVLMHEFGHTLGLAPGHSVGEGVMTNIKPRQSLSTNDEEGARATYKGHTAH